MVRIGGCSFHNHHVSHITDLAAVIVVIIVFDFKLFCVYLKSYLPHSSLPPPPPPPPILLPRSLPNLSSLKVKIVLPEKEKEVMEQITWRLDKLENEFLPQVEIGSTEVGGSLWPCVLHGWWCACV